MFDVTVCASPTTLACHTESVNQISTHTTLYNVEASRENKHTVKDDCMHLA